jgi:hypothetical protein
VSTSNSGGFTSVRSKNFTPPLDLSPYQGLTLRLKGNGLRYKCIIRTDANWDGIAYCRCVWEGVGSLLHPHAHVPPPSPLTC